MTPEQVTAALAARTPGPWRERLGSLYPDDPQPGAVPLPDTDLIGIWPILAGENAAADARAIVVAVNLADPLWRVAEAARAHTDAECSCLAVNWTHDDDCALVTTEAALRDALAALAATREEMP